MRHYCRHCQTTCDFINTRTTHCTGCALLGEGLESGEWVHISTLAGQLADRRAMELKAMKAK